MNPGLFEMLKTIIKDEADNSDETPRIIQLRRQFVRSKTSGEVNELVLKYKARSPANTTTA